MPGREASRSDFEIPLIQEPKEVQYVQVHTSSTPGQEINLSEMPLIQNSAQIPSAQIHYSPEASIPVGPYSSKVLCPSCRSTVLTRVEKVSTTKTHKFALKILCIVMFCACPCCAIIPYCMDSCKAANHFCPHCDTFLGTYDH